MKLFHRKYGESGPPMLILHGLYGSGDNWVSLSRELSSHFEVFVVDQRNHGRSPHSDVHDYPSMRDDLREFLDDHGISKALLLGHSMGAKTIMYFAVAWPERVQSLISVDMGPREYNDQATGTRFAANHSGIISALMELDLSSAGTREELDQALRTKIGSRRIRSFLLKNVERDEDGNFLWSINLQALRDNLDRILEGLPAEKIIASGGITGFPSLFISGEKSDYIRAEDHQLIRSIFPAAEFASIPNAGHWVHAEQPDLLVKTIRRFLDI